MQAVYKGHSLSATRTRGKNGIAVMCCVVMRMRDGYECFQDAYQAPPSMMAPVRDKLKELKKLVDAELSRSDPWGVEYKKYPLGYMQGRGAA